MLNKVKTIKNSGSLLDSIKSDNNLLILVDEMVSYCNENYANNLSVPWNREEVIKLSIQLTYKNLLKK